MRFFLALAAALFVVTSVQSAPDGEKLYNTRCSACHGIDGGGGVGVPLSLQSFLTSVPDRYLRTTIRQGRPGRVMPAFPSLSDAQVNAIIAFIRSWSDGPVPEYSDQTISGDAEHGSEIFQQRCASCHGEDAKGGKGTGVTFSRKRDFPLIAPALNNPGFLAAAPDEMLKYTITHGREGTIMSADFVSDLEDQDINDLVSYIRSFETQSTKKQKENDDAAVLVEASPYSLDETVENLKQAITNQNFTIIRTDYLEHGLTEAGNENKQQVLVHFCNFNFLYQALGIDPRVGVFLPCRVTVVEHQGKVQVMAVNPAHLSTIFNNDELDRACDEMTHIYRTILEDTVL